MARRLKPVKDLSVLILAPRKHDRQLWSELLKNCGINCPQSISNIEQAVTVVASGHADIVFVDDSYGAEGIANVLIPARNVEFAGGRGVCLILCSKKATMQDVINARKLGFASLVILPASTDTVRKHLELAAQYIPPTDDELGWSTPKAKAEQKHKGLRARKAPPPSEIVRNDKSSFAAKDPTPHTHTEVNMSVRGSEASRTLGMADAKQSRAKRQDEKPIASNQPEAPKPADRVNGKKGFSKPQQDQDLLHLNAPGRSGQSAEEEVVFL